MTVRAVRPVRRAAALLLVAALALAACSPGSGDDDGGASGDGVTVTFRLWDEAAASAYEESFAAFTEQNPDITVVIEQVPWANYWERLPLDFQSGDIADIFWTNTSNYGRYADSGNLMDLTDAFGDQTDQWNEAAVELYQRDDALWGIPQLTDSIALFYNQTLLDEAGVDPTDLVWSPDGSGDTLRPALEAVSTDDVYGVNVQNDLQAIWLNFLAQAGGELQDGDEFAFDSDAGVESFEYLTGLIADGLAPPAADTNANGDLARDLFVQGRLALFQSGQYSLSATADIGDSFEWGIAPMIAGPEGRIGVVHSVAAVANADTENADAVTEVLEWIGSAQGQIYLGETGSAFPAAVDAQQSFVDYWDSQGVDTTAFSEQAAGENTSSPLGPNANAGLDALGPYFQDMFLGELTVPDALEQAQTAANEAIAG